MPLLVQPRAGWWGALYGVLMLLATVVLVGGCNAAFDVVGNSDSSTAAGFLPQFGDACYDYIVKPMGYIMPLGSLVAGLLGWAAQEDGRCYLILGRHQGPPPR